MTKEFKKRDRVLYVPLHAHGNREHRDCERGVVVRRATTEENAYFVLYDGGRQSKLTYGRDLVLLEKGE